MTKTKYQKVPCRLERNLAWLRPFRSFPLVRLGSNHDGGYVIPAQTLDYIDGVLSFGIDRNWSFESDLRSIRPRLPLHAYDHTIHERFFYRELRKHWIRFFVFKCSWAELLQAKKTLADFRQAFSGNAVHYRQRITNRPESVSDVDFSLALQRLSGCRNLLVKIDIEGDEFRILPQILAHANFISVLVVEFHETGVLRETFRYWVQRIQKKFYLAHLHANNGGGLFKDNLPEFLEMTFVRGQPPSQRRNLHLPVRGIDYPNVASRPDYAVSWI